MSSSLVTNESNISDSDIDAITSFKLGTIDPNLFQIEDVINDNACFYRSAANAFNYSSSSFHLNEIKDLKDYGNIKGIDNVLGDAEWGYYGERQDKLARYLQGKAYRWIKRNYMTNLPEYGMDIATMLMATHDIDIETYLDRYKYFAGDMVVDVVDTGKVYKSGKKVGQAIIEEVPIEDRWGGSTEQIAFSEAYKLPIVILTSQKYDIRRGKIITGKIRNNKHEKDVRFKVFQILGKKYLTEKTPIFLLWKKHNKQGHYMSLYPKDYKNISNIVSKLLL